MDEYLKFKRLKIKKNCHLSTSDKIINYNPSLLKQIMVSSRTELMVEHSAVWRVLFFPVKKGIGISL
jgi:hypothetical protein